MESKQGMAIAGREVPTDKGRSGYRELGGTLVTEKGTGGGGGRERDKVGKSSDKDGRFGTREGEYLRKRESGNRGSRSGYR